MCSGERLPRLSTNDGIPSNIGCFWTVAECIPPSEFYSQSYLATYVGPSQEEQSVHHFLAMIESHLLLCHNRDSLLIHWPTCRVRTCKIVFLTRLRDRSLHT